jgi:hypothetical protein
MFQQFHALYALLPPSPSLQLPEAIHTSLYQQRAGSAASQTWHLPYAVMPTANYAATGEEACCHKCNIISTDAMQHPRHQWPGRLSPPLPAASTSRLITAAALQLPCRCCFQQPVASLPAPE